MPLPLDKTTALALGLSGVAGGMGGYILGRKAKQGAGRAPMPRTPAPQMSEPSPYDESREPPRIASMMAFEQAQDHPTLGLPPSNPGAVWAPSPSWDPDQGDSLSQMSAGELAKRFALDATGAIPIARGLKHLRSISPSIEQILTAMRPAKGGTPGMAATKTMQAPLPTIKTMPSPMPRGPGTVFDRPPIETTQATMAGVPPSMFSWASDALIQNQPVRDAILRSMRR